MQEFKTLVPGYGYRNRRPHVDSMKFRERSRVLQTPQEGWRTYWPKHCGSNNEDSSPKTLNDKKSFSEYRDTFNNVVKNRNGHVFLLVFFLMLKKKKKKRKERKKTLIHTKWKHIFRIWRFRNTSSLY